MKRTEILQRICNLRRKYRRAATVIESREVRGKQGWAITHLLGKAKCYREVADEINALVKEAEQ
jgi:hypothetical protein